MQYSGTLEISSRLKIAGEYSAWHFQWSNGWLRLDYSFSNGTDLVWFDDPDLTPSHIHKVTKESEFDEWDEDYVGLRRALVDMAPEAFTVCHGHIEVLSSSLSADQVGPLFTLVQDPDYQEHLENLEANADRHDWDFEQAEIDYLKLEINGVEFQSKLGIVLPSRHPSEGLPFLRSEIAQAVDKSSAIVESIFSVNKADIIAAKAISHSGFHVVRLVCFGEELWAVKLLASDSRDSFADVAQMISGLLEYADAVIVQATSAEDSEFESLLRSEARQHFLMLSGDAWLEFDATRELGSDVTSSKRIITEAGLVELAHYLKIGYFDEDPRIAREEARVFAQNLREPGMEHWGNHSHNLDWGIFG